MTSDNRIPEPFQLATDWHWHAIYVRPSHEVQVAKRFSVREIESYLPQYQVQHRWKNRCTNKDRAAFVSRLCLCSYLAHPARART